MDNYLKNLCNLYSDLVLNSLVSLDNFKYLNNKRHYFYKSCKQLNIPDSSILQEHKAFLDFAKHLLLKPNISNKCITYILKVITHAHIAPGKIVNKSNLNMLIKVQATTLTSALIHFKQNEIENNIKPKLINNALINIKKVLTKYNNTFEK